MQMAPKPLCDCCPGSCKKKKKMVWYFSYLSFSVYGLFGRREKNRLLSICQFSGYYTYSTCSLDMVANAFAGTTEIRFPDRYSVVVVVSWSRNSTGTLSRLLYLRSLQREREGVSKKKSCCCCCCCYVEMVLLLLLLLLVSHLRLVLTGDRLLAGDPPRCSKRRQSKSFRSTTWINQEH